MTQMAALCNSEGGLTYGGFVYADMYEHVHYEKTEHYTARYPCDNKFAYINQKIWMFFFVSICFWGAYLQMCCDVYFTFHCTDAQFGLIL